MRILIIYFPILLVLIFYGNNLLAGTTDGPYASAALALHHSLNSNSQYFDSTKSKGYAFGIGFHLKKTFLVEGTYEKYQFEGKLCPGMSRTYYYVLEEKIIGITLRYYFLEYFGVKVGYHSHTFSRRLFYQGTHEEVESFSWDYTAKLPSYSYGVGFRLPFSIIDIFGEYTRHDFGKNRKSNTALAGIRGYLP